VGTESVVFFPSRGLPLPGGRTLLIRPVEAPDSEGIVTLYESLGEDDLYFRFFQGHMPPRTTLEKMASAEERGGFRLIAELRDRDGTRRIVGECGYELLSDGDGELAITVARDARGWLGPYMLDALADVAGARGIANLQADVLTENRRMLALVHARGYATMDHSSCPAIVRVVIGTAQRVPTWPRLDARLRALVEAEGGRWHREVAMRAAGVQVLVCPGPLAKWSRCPAVQGRPCPLAEGADLVVDSIPSDSAPGGALLEAHERLHAAVPLCLEIHPGDREPDADHALITYEMDDVEVVHRIKHMAIPRFLARTGSHPE
jgi:hypothetical protein